jgi:GAF domain-containing protein
MSKTAPTASGIREIITLHEANYAVFQAKSERDVFTATRRALQQTGCAAAYYSVSERGLELEVWIDAESAKQSPLFPKHIEIAATAIAQYFSDENGVIAKLAQTQFAPDELAKTWAELGAQMIATFPAIQDVVTVGAILIVCKQGQQFDKNFAGPLAHLAQTIPVAIENVKAARATQQRLRELEAISETSQVISASNDLQSIYRILDQQIGVTMGDVDFSVALYEPLNETIEITHSIQDGKPVRMEPFPLGEGLISILIRTRQPLMLIEDTEHRLKALGGRIVGKAPKSWLGCPLVMGGEAIGALVVQDTEKEGRFSQDDLRLLTSLSSQVAGAIYNIRLLEDARRRALQLQTVAEISREVSSSLIVDNLLRQAVQLVRERFDFYHAAIFLVDPSGEYAVIREATGDAGQQMKRAGHKLAVGSKSIVGYVLKNKDSLVVNNTAKDPNYYANPLLPDTRAEATLPLMIGERVLGVMDVQSTRPYAFTEENIKILQILADQLAVAVVNSELFAEAQERLSQHRLLHHVTTAAASSTTIEEALNSAVQGLQVTLGGDQIAILLADREQKQLEVKASIGYPNEESAKLKVPFGVGITGWVAAHRQAQRVDDVTKDSRYIAVNSKIRSELSIPLIYRNEVLGVLNVESPRASAYSENDEEMLGTLAGSLAAIIAHSRLLEQFRTQVERERLLYEVTNKIRRTTNPEKILEITAGELGKVLRTQRVAVKIDVANPGAEKKQEISLGRRE